MRRLAVAVLLAAGAEASTGGKPRSDLPPLFLVPSLCGSRIRAWSAPQCTIGSISPGTNTWVNPAMIGGQPYCWCECMRLWGPQMSDLYTFTYLSQGGLGHAPASRRATTVRATTPRPRDRTTHAIEQTLASMA